MNRFALTATSLVMALASAAAVGRNEPHSNAVPVTAAVEIPAASLHFRPTGVKIGGAEVFAAPAYGDLAHGAHGTFIRMPANFPGEFHTHANGYHAVLISGTLINHRPHGAEVELTSGSYWFQPGGEVHRTKCVSAVPCVMFIAQPGAFDYAPGH